MRVWSECGATIPIGDTTAHFRFTFGHERIAKNDTVAEIRKTATLIDEFNAAEMERRMDEYVRVIKRIMSGEKEQEPQEARPTRRGVRDRAKAKIK